MIVAVPAMMVVQMIADEVVDVSSVRNGLVSAAVAVKMFFVVHPAAMGGRARCRVVA